MTDRRGFHRQHELHLTLTLAAAIIIITGLYLLSTFAAWYVTVGVAVWIAGVGFALALCSVAGRADREFERQQRRTYGRLF